ncbi:MAG: hypothetical protein WC614_07665 [bacterium]
MKENAGLDVENYDSHIVKELCEGLSIPFPCKDLGVELQEQNISSGLFIGAFLTAIQPYAQMMTDICAFFYLHDVKKTNKEMKILFDFGKGIEDLKFDINHFKETLCKYRKISERMTIYGCSQNELWKLAQIFRDLWEYKLQTSDTGNWLLDYEQNKKFNFPLPILPSTGIKEIDSWLQKVWHILETIILECRKYGSSLDDLKKYAHTWQEENSEIKNEQEESYESIKHSQELPNFKKWDPWTLYILNSDRWPRNMLRGLFGFSEKLVKIPEIERISEAQPIIQQIQEFFSNLPHWEGKKELLIKELLDLLNLPIWNKRHELYQTWVLTQIDKALEKYPRTIYHVEGVLILRFSGTHVGSIETEKGRIHIWSELRSPLTNPIGEGRKGHIQPDYSLTFEPITEPSQTVLAIECKQYQRAKSKNFVDALTDYANGRPNAKVILVNYENIPEKMLSQIDENLKLRTLPIGNFIPDRLEKFKIFKDAFIQSMPNFTNFGRKLALKELQFDLIAVDISASMEKILDEQRVLKTLQVIINASPTAKLLAINTSATREWPKANIGLNELLTLPRNGSTDLPSALSIYDLSNCSVILTDNDGWNQLNKISILPYLVIEARADKTLEFYFRD